jgi:virginiamycin B lyase
MINPGNPNGTIAQYPIPTANSGPGPIAAGPQPILYASDAAKNQIYEVDKTNGTLLKTIPVSKAQDSLIFDSHNDLIYTLGYSASGPGQVRMVDPSVGLSSDTLLATIGNNPGDLALAPGGNFVLALGRADGKIYKVDLNHPGQTPTSFGSGQYTGGIVYDGSGRLFAVTNSGVVELNPTNFTVMASSGTLTQLDGLAFDPFTGNLFASSHAVGGVSGQQGIYELSLQPASFLHATLITSSAVPANFLPDGLEPDGEGNLYVASFQDRIYRIDLTTGKMTALTNTLSGLDDLVPLQGSGGHTVPDYWFFEQAADKFGAIDPTTGHITELPPLAAANPQVDGIAAGPGETVWFTEFNTNRIGVINTDTDQISEFPLPTPGAHPYGIVEGPDGTIWFTEAGANRIGRINPTTDAIQEFPIDPSGNDEAEGIAIGPDSNLWFTLTGTGKIGVMSPTTGAMIGEYSVPTGNAGLGQIVSNPADGNLWFTEPDANKVGRINPATKAIAEFAVPTAGAAPQAIAVARSGTVWIAESDAGRIAELSPSNPGIITEYVVAVDIVPNPGPNPTGGGTTPQAPTVRSEEVLTMQKTNKRGKRVGKPVLVGFELDYSTAMNPARAGLAANYQVIATTTQRIKRRRVSVTAPVAVQATYDASRNAVTLTIVGKQTFAKGGRITINATPPNGVADAAGDFLAVNDTVFTILPKASGIWPG